MPNTCKTYSFIHIETDCNFFVVQKTATRQPKEYCLFGAPMPGRNYTSASYRYGFNGQEKDDEIAGNGNSMTAEYWQYDTRLGRRWNLDPVVKDAESPYACFSDNPIYFADPSGSNTVTPTGGGDAPIMNGGSLPEVEVSADAPKKNTPKGQLTVNYSPINFNQVGGNVRIKPQNDFSYLPPNATGNYGLGQPDEASSIVTANFLLKRQTFGGRSSIDYSGGVSFTSLKGGILNNGLNYGDDPHFGSGYRTLGVNAIVDYNLSIVNGFSLFGSLNLGGGASLSDFGENSTTGSIVIPRKGYPGWGTHGAGATGVAHVGFSVTPKLWKATSRDIIKLNISAVFVAHSIRVSPYTIQTNNGPVSHGVSNATFIGTPRIDATLSIDILPRR